jgi:hypothetical protein
MEKSLKFATNDCRFESCQGHGPRRKQSSREADVTRESASKRLRQNDCVAQVIG